MKPFLALAIASLLCGVQMGFARSTSGGNELCQYGPCTIPRLGSLECADYTLSTDSSHNSSHCRTNITSLKYTFNRQGQYPALRLSHLPNVVDLTIISLIGTIDMGCTDMHCRDSLVVRGNATCYGWSVPDFCKLPLCQNLSDDMFGIGWGVQQTARTAYRAAIAFGELLFCNGTSFIPFVAPPPATTLPTTTPTTTPTTIPTTSLTTTLTTTPTTSLTTTLTTTPTTTPTTTLTSKHPIVLRSTASKSRSTTAVSTTTMVLPSTPTWSETIATQENIQSAYTVKSPGPTATRNEPYLPVSRNSATSPPAGTINDDKSKVNGTSNPGARGGAEGFNAIFAFITIITVFITILLVAFTAIHCRRNSKRHPKRNLQQFKHDMEVCIGMPQSPSGSKQPLQHSRSLRSMQSLVRIDELEDLCSAVKRSQTDGFYTSTAAGHGKLPRTPGHFTSSAPISGTCVSDCTDPRFSEHLSTFFSYLSSSCDRKPLPPVSVYRNSCPSVPGPWRKPCPGLAALHQASVGMVASSSLGSPSTECCIGHESTSVYKHTISRSIFRRASDPHVTSRNVYNFPPGYLLGWYPVKRFSVREPCGSGSNVYHSTGLKIDKGILRDAGQECITDEECKPRLSPPPPVCIYRKVQAVPNVAAGEDRLEESASVNSHGKATLSTTAAAEPNMYRSLDNRATNCYAHFLPPSSRVESDLNFELIQPSYRQDHDKYDCLGTVSSHYPQYNE